MVLGWGFVGTGDHVYARMAPAAQRARHTKLAAVCSRDLRQAERCARQFGFLRAYVDYQTMLRDDAIDIVYIATPNALHSGQAVAAMRAGKHVLVEKPLALSEVDAAEALAASRRYGVRLGVGYQLRHHPAHQAAANMVREGRIGEIRYAALQFCGVAAPATGWWRDPDRAGAYVFTRRGVHLVDLMLFLLPGEPLRVMAATNGQQQDRELEDTAVALIELEGATFVTLAASCELTSCRNGFALYGTSGAIRVEDTFGASGGVLELSLAEDTQRTEYPVLDLYQREIEAFNARVRGEDEEERSAVDAVRGVRIATAVLRSARDRAVVTLGEPTPPRHHEFT